MLSAPRAKIAKILREIQALPTQILRECDAKRTTFSTPNTPPTRSSTAPTSCRCRSDAVRSLGALNINNATDLQVVCNRSAHFRTEKCARTRRRARNFATPNASPPFFSPPFSSPPFSSVGIFFFFFFCFFFFSSLPEMLIRNF